MKPGGITAIVTAYPSLVRVRLRNYRSIANCDVALGPLTFLVGPNGSGKSNFVDALRFVAESVRENIDHALRIRGGISSVRRLSTGHPTHFGITLNFEHEQMQAAFGFQIEALPEGGFQIQREQCEISTGSWAEAAFYGVEKGTFVRSSIPVPPAAVGDRLYLANVSGYPQFRPMYEWLASMGFYNLNPDQIREHQPAGSGELLLRDGRNLPSVLRTIEKHDPAVMERIRGYLAAVVPGIQNVEPVQVETRETLRFLQQVKGAEAGWRFSAAQMSDGTLRALGVLVALFQGKETGESRLPLVAIEEPESALHPAAAATLLEAILEASQRRQVIVTSHSADLLDHKDLPENSILSVNSIDSNTVLGGVDDASRETLRNRLYTPGELLRMRQLAPSEESVRRASRQIDLFRDFSKA